MIDIVAVLVQAAKELGLTSKGEAVLGYNSKSISIRAKDASGKNVWLKIRKALKPPIELSVTFPGKPKLMLSQSINHNGVSCFAEVYEYISEPLVSSSPLLLIGVQIEDGWLESLAEKLKLIKKLKPNRTTITSPMMAAKIRKVFGHNISISINSFSPVHGDLHWANLTQLPLHIFDWENFGMGPLGFDEAFLLACTLENKPVCFKIERTFAKELNTPDAKNSLLYAYAELLDRLGKSRPGLTAKVKQEVNRLGLL